MSDQLTSDDPPKERRDGPLLLTYEPDQASRILEQHIPCHAQASWLSRDGGEAVRVAIILQEFLLARRLGQLEDGDFGAGHSPVQARSGGKGMQRQVWSYVGLIEGRTLSLCVGPDERKRQPESGPLHSEPMSGSFFRLFASPRLGFCCGALGGSSPWTADRLLANCRRQR